MRRNWLAVALLVAIAAVVLAVVGVRAGDDGVERVETAEWASAVCTSLSEWRATVTALTDVSPEEVTPELLRERLAEADEATDELVTELRELGTPDLEVGDEVEQALDDAIAGLDTSYQALRAAVDEAADAATPAEFVQAITDLADDYQRLLTQIEGTVAVLQSASLFGEASAELEEAFEGAESCEELRSTG